MSFRIPPTGAFWFADGVSRKARSHCYYLPPFRFVRGASFSQFLIIGRTDFSSFWLRVPVASIFDVGGALRGAKKMPRSLYSG